MAQPIHCDHQGSDPHLADQLISRLATGDTTAWCDPHYLEVVMAIAGAVAEAEADTVAQEAQEALDRAGRAAVAEIVNAEYPAIPGPEAGDQELVPPTSTEPSAVDGPPAGSPGNAPGASGSPARTRRATRTPSARQRGATAVLEGPAEAPASE